MGRSDGVCEQRHVHGFTLLHIIASLVYIMALLFSDYRIVEMCMRLRIVLLTILLTLFLCAGITFVSVMPTHAQQTTQACTNPSCNPWGFNFHPGKFITHPPARFCTVFACIANFLNGRGYVEECRDAKYYNGPRNLDTERG